MEGFCPLDLFCVEAAVCTGPHQRGKKGNSFCTGGTGANGDPDRSESVIDAQTKVFFDKL
jgi:hypothetical protein